MYGVIIWVVLDAGLPHHHEVEALLNFTWATLTLFKLHNLKGGRSEWLQRTLGGYSRWTGVTVAICISLPER